MDVVNLDYIVGTYLNPIWILPNLGYSILGSFYHGTATLSIGLVCYTLFSIYRYF